MSITKEQITAALQRLGPSAPRGVADHLGAEASALSHHVRAMLKDGELKAAGRTMDRVIALPDQKIEGTKSAPPQRRPARKKKSKLRKGAAPSTPQPKPKPADDFIPAFTADARLVIVNGSTPPQIFTPQQTERMATLLASYFEDA